MKKKPRFSSLLLVLAALCFAGLVIFVSLQSANNQQTATANLRQRRFYVQKEILPDHSLYPLLMIYDRIRLELADQEHRIPLYLAYAQRRSFYAQRLLAKGESTLALTTYSKAIKYLDQALLSSAEQLAVAGGPSKKQQELAFLAIESSGQTLTAIAEQQPYFTDAQRGILDVLIAESTVLRNQIQEKLFQL